MKNLRYFLPAAVIACCAPVTAATFLPPEIRTLEEGGIVRFQGVPPEGVTLPAAKEPHLCNPWSYPGMALRMNREGAIWMEFLIQADGTISPPKVVRRDGPNDFDKPSLACVAKWAYHPATQDGRAVPVLNTVKVTWRIGPKASAWEDRR